MSAEQLIACRPFAPGAWRHHLLHGYGGRPLAERRDARLRAARVTLLDLRPQPGVAWFPLVAPEDRANRDLLPGVLASVRVGGPTPLPADGQRRVVAWVTALVGEPAQRWATPPALGFGPLPPGWTVNGDSWQLAAALALLTHILERHARTPLVVSAALAQPSTAGAIAGFGGLAHKRRILEREAPDTAHLLAAAPGPAPLGDWLPSGWRSDLGMRLDVSPELRAKEMWSAWRRGDQATAERLVPVVLASRHPQVQAVAWWVRGSAALHRGDAATGLADLSRARDVLLEHRPTHQYQVEELDASLGIARLDGLDPVTACALLGDAMDRLAAVSLADRFARWREVTVPVAGSYRRALVATGDLDRARQVQQTWALGHAHLDPERARCLLDLADVCLRQGDTTAAAQALEQAQAALAHTHGPAKLKTQRFLRIQRVRASLEPPPGDWLEDRGPRWDLFPQPLELAEALLHLEDRATLDRALPAWTTQAPPLECYVTSRLAALLLLRHPDLAWAQAVLQGLRPHVDDTRMGPGARAALDAALRGDSRAWAARVAY